MTEEFWLDLEADSLNPHHEAQQRSYVVVSGSSVGGLEPVIRLHRQPVFVALQSLQVSLDMVWKYQILQQNFWKRNRFEIQHKKFSSSSSASCYVCPSCWDEEKNQEKHAFILKFHSTHLMFCLINSTRGNKNDNWLSEFNSGLYLHECCDQKFLEGQNVWQFAVDHTDRLAVPSTHQYITWF